MAQRQHVLSEWLLKAFSRSVGGGYLVTAYDKTSGQYDEYDPEDFMTEIGAHSTEIEREISRIETPAAQAARTLRKRARTYPAGFYAVTDQAEELRAAGPLLSDKGIFAGTRLLVSEHTIRTPRDPERLALGRYAGLMYQRAPSTEASILAWGETFDDGIQDTLNRVFPGMRSPVETTLAHRRARIADLATRIGSGLASASWFIVRSGPGEAFVLSDTPVVATVAFGFDDEWHAILSAESNVIVMPLNPVIALVMAPRHIIPLSNVDATALVPAINRLMWRAAARFVLGRNRAEVGAALGDVDDASRGMTVRPRHDAGVIRRQAEKATERSVLEALVQHRIMRPLAAGWQHWIRCRLELGYAPFAAEDRDLVMGPSHHSR